MDLRCCRFCSEAVASKHSIGLFTNQAALSNLTTRLSTLLQLPISENDGLSSYSCRQCRDSLLNLERKLADTRNRVRAIYQRMSGKISMAPLVQNSVSDHGAVKRTKDTSGGPGVSPATSKARPPSKRLTVSRTLFPQGMKQICISPYNIKLQQNTLITNTESNENQKPCIASRDNHSTRGTQ